MKKLIIVLISICFVFAPAAQAVEGHAAGAFYVRAL